ncbi:MAG: ferrochelatase, partial [Actinomycetota bacterium]
VVLAPIGFVSDHMEVAFDLDTEAMDTAGRLGLAAVRAATAGTHPAFVAAVRDLLVERAAVERGERPVRASIGPPGPWHDVCPAGCCPNPRGPRPALGGADSG